MRLLLISCFLMLNACGPSLFTLKGIGTITVGDVAISPIKKKIIDKIRKKPSKRTIDN